LYKKYSYPAEPFLESDYTSINCNFVHWICINEVQTIIWRQHIKCNHIVRYNFAVNYWFGIDSTYHIWNCNDSV